MACAPVYDDHGNDDDDDDGNDYDFVLHNCHYMHTVEYSSGAPSENYIEVVHLSSCTERML
eukprot:1561073-Karenia_brevis.AAC.1